MKNILIIIVIVFLTGCSNWRYKDITYHRYQHLEKLHTHFYDHETCEWSCLNMEEGNYTYEDIVRVKYKMNKKGRKVTCKLPNGVAWLTFSDLIKLLENEEIN
jgi:hypothetical protein